MRRDQLVEVVEVKRVNVVLEKKNLERYIVRSNNFNQLKMMDLGDVFVPATKLVQGSNSIIKCSNCMSERRTSDYADWKRALREKYCPCCGARFVDLEHKGISFDNLDHDTKSWMGF